MQEFFIESLKFGERAISLRDDQIVCIVGPNSSGKSAFLEKLQSLVLNGKPTRKSILSDLHLSKTEIKEKVSSLLHGVAKVQERALGFRGTSLGTGDTDAEEYFFRVFRGELKSHMFAPLVDFVNARERLSGVGPVAHVNLLTGGAAHPLHSLYQHPETERKLSAISERLFGFGIALNPGAGSGITLHTGNPVNALAFGGNRTQEYANEVSRLPTISEQGDGVQATIGLIARLVTSKCPCILVDEPDLYLHPPQAYELGAIIGKEVTGRQLFFSTHSSKFLQGLFREAPNRLKILRLQRGKDSEYHLIEVDTSIINEVKSDSILKFTGILDCLFYESLVLCEDSSDCLFFKTLLERLEFLPNEQKSFWIGVFGKGNFAKVLRIARAVGVRTFCVVDFDLISSRSDSIGKVLKPMIEALGGDSAPIVEKARTIAKSVDSNGKLRWDRLKEGGLSEVNSDPHLFAMFSALLSELEAFGIYALRNGETESLCTPRVGDHGAEAVSKMLEFDVTSDARLVRARTEAEAIARLLN